MTSPARPVRIGRIPIAAWGVLVALGATAASAANRAELTVVTPERGNITGSQQWVQAFGQTGVRNVRFRSPQSGDVMGIERAAGSGETTYYVTGSMNSRGEIEVPGKKFRMGDARGVVAWLNDLAANGLPEEREATAAFGLPESQWNALRRELSLPVPGATKGQTRAAAVRQIAAAIKTPLRADPSMKGELEADTIAEELEGFSCGTALACIVRPAGLALVPQQAGDRVELRIVRAGADQEVWPIGWESEKPERDLLPELFEILNANIQGVTVSQALEAMAARLKVPAFCDHNAIARHGLEPEKTVVQLPPGKTTLSAALRRVLFQAGLKHEVRVDEAGRLFLWVTSVKPL